MLWQMHEYAKRIMVKNNDTSVQYMSNMYIVVTSHLIFVA
jgi:hypothetical protein